MTVVYSDVYRRANRDSAVSLSFMGPVLRPITFAPYIRPLSNVIKKHKT